MDDDNTVGIADAQTQAVTFAQIVMLDVRGAADADQQQMLRTPENIGRWLADLDEEHAAFLAERTTAAAGRWRAAQLAHGRWRAGATRMLQRVRERQREARALKHRYAAEQWETKRAEDPLRRPLADSVDELRARIDRLEARLARLVECPETAGVAL